MKKLQLTEETRRKLITYLLSLNLVGLLLLVLAYQTLPEYKTCTYLNKATGEEIQGNCTWLAKEIDTRQESIVDTINGSELLGISNENRINPIINYVDNITIVYVYECNSTTTTTEPPTTTSATTTTTEPPTTTSEPTTTTIPLCEMPYCQSEDPKIIRKALDYHPTGTANIPYLDGAGDCKDFYLDLFEIKGRSPFKSRTTPTGSGMYYVVRSFANNTVDETPTGETFIFRNIGGSFILNRTPDNNGRQRWGWNDTQCEGSWLEIKELG